jgi:hypothetical protein
VVRASSEVAAKCKLIRRIFPAGIGAMAVGCPAATTWRNLSNRQDDGHGIWLLRRGTNPAPHLLVINLGFAVKNPNIKENLDLSKLFTQVGDPPEFPRNLL